MVKITGTREFADKLRRIRGPEMEASLTRALFKAGQLVQDHAQASIMRGAMSGKGHMPSKPGEPPSNDTQVLHNNIETVVASEPGRPAVHVPSNAPYSASLEYGTSRMEARPFMRPALAAKEGEAKALVAQAVDQIIAGGRIR